MVLSEYFDGETLGAVSVSICSSLTNLHQPTSSVINITTYYRWGRAGAAAKRRILALWFEVVLMLFSCFLLFFFCNLRRNSEFGIQVFSVCKGVDGGGGRGGGVRSFFSWYLDAVQILGWREFRQEADIQGSDAGLPPFIFDATEEQITGLPNEEIITCN